MIRDNVCTWTWFVTIYTHGRDSWRQYIHMDTTHVHMYILSRLRSDDRHSMQWAALESYHSWISFSRSLLPCFSEKRPMRLRSDDTQYSRLYSSHVIFGSRSPGLFCHVSVKRALWDWDWDYMTFQMQEAVLELYHIYECIIRNCSFSNHQGVL